MKVTQMNSLSPKKIPVPVPDEIPVARPMPSGRNLSYNIKEMLSKFNEDDYILLGLIAVLIFEGCDDYILLAALGYLFFMGVK